MVRNRKRTTDNPIAAFTEDDMIAAVELVCAGRCLRDAVKEKNGHTQHVLLYRLLYCCRYVKKKKANPDTDVQMRPKYDCRCVFSDEEEGHLVTYLLECAKMCYGLDTIETHRLGYEMAMHNDEIGTSTVQNTKKILAPKCVKQLNKVTSGEKGTLVTTCCIISDSGVALPPAMVFPQVHFKEHIPKGASPGILGLAAQSGWMNNELFARVMQHFVKVSHSDMIETYLYISIA
ncbi:hypothetical protein PR048_009231, partial [Dryococelus australis]